ncbi:hypothetical protein MKW94_009892 [Papaver nudicaule]|uniref:Uncharacterized protein n=1 Tax=Papaver nudicaule TaxID=74823 RepID=A0AA42AZW5_PAPNU|nr:hypothetical protein [Papaver nudicaule]
MSTNARAVMAMNAMKAIGISGSIVKPVLKNLLTLYDKNWSLIEDENYRVLADAIFDYEENKGDENQKKEADSTEESGPRLKRLRKTYQDDQPPPSGETSSRMQKGPAHDQPQNGLGEEGMEPSNHGEGISGLEAVPLNMHLPRRNEELSLPRGSPMDETEEPPQLHLRRKRSEPEPILSPTIPYKDKGKEPLVMPPTCIRSERVVPTPLRIRDDRDEPRFISPLIDQRNKAKEPISAHQVPPRENRVVTGGAPALDQFSEGKLANGDQSNCLINPQSEPSSDDLLPLELPIAVIHPPSPDCGKTEDNDRNVCNGHRGVETLSSRDADADAEDKGLSGPGTACNNGEALELANVTDATPANVDIVSSNSGEVIEPQAPRLLALDGMDDFHGTTTQSVKEVLARPSDETEKTVEPKDPEFPNERDMRMEQTDTGSLSPSVFVGVQNKMFIPGDIIPVSDTPVFLRPLHDVNDIAKGEENFRISAVNEVSSEPYPPLFFYIPQNIIFRSAHVKCTLSRIADEDCCLNCFGDCMSSSIPCACARVTGGDFAYTLEGCLKESFLNECISMNRNPQNHLFYCESCPLERNKNGDLRNPCKGHLERKFIKECWSKCGCNKQCGNRVVQRGLSSNLQVYLTAEGKGWGLRTLDDLPRGTFVCEYVGEILTTKELNERNTEITDGDKQTCPVLLDAAWGSDGVLKDKEALCLDATFYGNVARFINHRCFDANLVEIPVEVESPNHRYYHVAFFTTRDIEALEELTWDYGIDFDNSNHPVKGFRCRCGSKSCRDTKRSQKAKLNPLFLR